MRLIWLSLGMTVATTIGVSFYRAYGLPGQEIASAVPAEQIEVAAVSERLQQAIRIPTVSTGKADQAYQPFADFQAFLRSSFPRVFSTLDVQVVNQHSLLLRWPGSDLTLQPDMLIAHQDVVPVGDLANWQHPPFAGHNDGEMIWGRGTLDDKSSLMAILEAAELMLAQGLQPKRTLYFGFGHDEEVGGANGAAAIAELMQTQQIRPRFILDEGGIIAKPGMLPGLIQPVAMLGIAEKGYLNLRLTTQADGGHSSSPASDTAISRLTEVLQALHDEPFVQRLDYLDMTFSTASESMGFPERVLFSNLWLFGNILKPVISGLKSANAMTRTTMVPTILDAGFKENVIPRQASAIFNFRLLPGDTDESVIAHVKQVVSEDVSIEILDYNPPSPMGSADNEAYGLIRQAIQQSWQQQEPLVVAPYLMYAGTDLANYYDVSDSQYRFMFVPLNNEELGTMHNVNERIRISDYVGMINFYYRLMHLSAM
ncbi:M20/M25/M40 family metallo-hydrolase [Pseudobowmanella zhangzhouensis]|uniref:M20/M25/M40 family metallo-hydrolase n=1 Tax=Pseudobowmanella zhangzhouensis TaxID=1537679 RepID=UPI0036213C96